MADMYWRCHGQYNRKCFFKIATASDWCISSTSKLSTNVFTVRLSHPQHKQKHFKGSDIMVGGSIIIPIDIQRACYNHVNNNEGISMKNPIWKPRLSSRQRREPQWSWKLVVGFWCILSQLNEQVEILTVCILQHELLEGFPLSRASSVYLSLH